MIVASLCWDEVALYWFVCQTSILSWQFIDWIAEGCRRRGLDELPDMATPFYSCAGCLQLIQAMVMLLVFIPTQSCAQLASDAPPEGEFYYWIPAILAGMGIHSLLKAYRFSQQIEKSSLDPFAVAAGLDEYLE